MADDSDKCNYEVGYGKPPKANQFQPGTSGNPKGRRKGSRNLKDFAREELDRKQRVTADGKMRSLSNREIIVLAQINKARKGDSKAFREILALDEGLQADVEKHMGRTDLSPDERKILEAHLAYLKNKPSEAGDDV
ncbi:hypothetical protein DK847_16775 [Aestuariivirga litoralis]|uniref:DUF5681 domain-containing protein n=1 Tax=Aestuariivirga litoralis TaxID=2650924 RepID=A0A2W2B6D2_9HYPH|nr:DUF5681 domain-containing protein [Aestuariivirga litoralis]PZF75874.1 hypothetical protein DK847_16775 [Aestuariivirga litoralis]